MTLQLIVANEQCCIDADITHLNKAHQLINEGKIFKITDEGNIVGLSRLERIRSFFYAGDFVNKMMSYVALLAARISGNVHEIARDYSNHPVYTIPYLQAVKALVQPLHEPTLLKNIRTTITLAEEVLRTKEAEEGSIEFKASAITVAPSPQTSSPSSGNGFGLLAMIAKAASWLFGCKEAPVPSPTPPPETAGDIETGTATDTAEEPGMPITSPTCDYSMAENLPNLEECLKTLPITITEEQRKRGVTEETIRGHVKFQMEYFKGIASGEVSFSLPFGGKLRTIGNKVKENGKDVQESVTLFDSWTFMLKSKVLHHLSLHNETTTANLFFNGAFGCAGFYESCGNFFKKEVCTELGKITAEGKAKLQEFYTNLQFSDPQATKANAFIEKGEWTAFLQFLINETTSLS